MNDPLPLQGLTATEVAERIRRGQTNRPPRSAWREYADVVRRNLLTLFNALVLPAAIALYFLERYQPALAVSGMAVVNTLVGLVQELRAKRHLEKLAILTETRARVLRTDGEVTLPAGDVVLGDVLLLRAGEPIVADGPVLESRFLEVDEALLTGESDPVPRRTGEPLLSGSFCVAGEGAYRAEKVGGASFAQYTSQLARSYRYAASPMQRSINFLVGALTYTAVALCGWYVLLFFLHRPEDPAARREAEQELAGRVAATATSMVPQGLVLVINLAFILGAARLVRRGAIVQRLSAVESMAAVDVLCMDKTGTLTTNRLRLDRIVPLHDAPTEEAIRRRLRLFASASLDRGNKNLAALRDALGEVPVELLDQLPFKSQNRYSAVRVRDADGEFVLVLGAWEALRGVLPPEDAGAGEPVWRGLLGSGLRLLLFAEAEGTGPFEGTLRNYRPRPLALLALSDELRPEAGRVLAELAAQGVGFKVISGDNPETVRATIGHLELPLAQEPVVHGEELATAHDARDLIAGRSVFGRVAPQQKVEIVTTLQQLGRHVAMIGDGVNDVLPIKAADLGIAMGEGSSASRTVAGLVLENNNFELLPATLDEGRVIVRNLRRSARLFLLKNVYSLVLIVGALAVFGLPFPYAPQQVTLLNFLTIGVPSLLVTLTRQVPRGPRGGNFLREVGEFALPTGLVMGGAGLLILGLAPDDVRLQRTMLLTLLIALGLVAMLRALWDGEPGEPRDVRFPMLAAAATAVYLTCLYWPTLADFFELVPLNGGQWGLVAAVGLPAWGATWLLSRLTGAMGASRPGGRSG